MLAIISCNHPFLGRPFEETKSHLIPAIDSSQLFVLYPRFQHGFFIYPAYNEQNKEGKLLTAIFAPLVGAVLKIICRISVQRLRNVTHPGQSYVLIAPVYFGSVILSRVLQADLHGLRSMVTLGIIHGV